MVGLKKGIPLSKRAYMVSSMIPFHDAFHECLLRPLFFIIAMLVGFVTEAFSIGLQNSSLPVQYNGNSSSFPYVQGSGETAKEKRIADEVTLLPGCCSLAGSNQVQ